MEVYVAPETATIQIGGREGHKEIGAIPCALGDQRCLAAPVLVMASSWVATQTAWIFHTVTGLSKGQEWNIETIRKQRVC